MRRSFRKSSSCPSGFVEQFFLRVVQVVSYNVLAHRRLNTMQAIKLRFVVESLCEDNGNQSQGSGARSGAGDTATRSQTSASWLLRPATCGKMLNPLFNPLLIASPPLPCSQPSVRCADPASETPGTMRTRCQGHAHAGKKHATKDIRSLTTNKDKDNKSIQRQA